MSKNEHHTAETFKIPQELGEDQDTRYCSMTALAVLVAMIAYADRHGTPGSVDRYFSVVTEYSHDMCENHAQCGVTLGDIMSELEVMELIAHDGEGWRITWPPYVREVALREAAHRHAVEAGRKGGLAKADNARREAQR